MPVQKGKRRKRPRHRGIGGEHVDAPQTVVQSSAPVRTRRQRQRWQPPLWFNVALGFAMIVFGIFFFATQSHGMAMQERLLLLLGYFVVAGFYLAKAFQQYRARRQS
jgi:hypothetical protein